jgi:glycerophosphoryl diester phosphodiesterase
MAAFRKARDLGAPGIELDIHLSAASGGGPGALVVSHDGHFGRTAPGSSIPGGRTIEEMSWEEIRQIDVGSFFGPEFRGERAPLLEEVLREYCPGMYIDIELKSGGAGDLESIQILPLRLAELLRSLGPDIERSVTVSSFNPLSIAAFRRAASRTPIPTAVIWSDGPQIPRPLRHGFGRHIARCDYLKPDSREVSASLGRLARREGRPLVPWTVDDPEEARRVLDLGAEGIITNRPQDFLNLFSGR